MFMVEFAPGGGGSHHTHPFEESYFFLDGAGDCEFEGKKYVVEPLTCCWTASARSTRSTRAARRR